MTVLRPWHLIALSVDYKNIMLTLEQKATTHPWKQSISFYNKYLEVCLYNAWKIVNLKKKNEKIRYQQRRIQGRGALLNFQTKLRPEGTKKNWGGPPPLSKGLDESHPTPPPYLKVWIQHWPVKIKLPSSYRNIWLCECHCLWMQGMRFLSC